jgi:hypothetical protein
MKQIVKLTKEETGTVHVDDVDVSKGVKVTDNSHPGVGFVFKSEAGYYITWTCSNGSSFHFENLNSLIGNLDCSFYTLDGLRITTEREITVDDLQNTDHVGLIIGGDKCHIVQTGDGPTFIAVDLILNEQVGVCNAAYTKHSKSMLDCMLYLLEDFNVTEIYKFTTRKELYAWLSE